MDEHFYDNNFEKFLQQQLKHHRMYPSDAVWKGIYQQMHGDKKWPGLYFIAILMVAALTVCTIFMDTLPIEYPEKVLARMEQPTHDHLNPAATTEHTIQRIKMQRVAALHVHEPALPHTDITVAVPEAEAMEIPANTSSPNRISAPAEVYLAAGNVNLGDAFRTIHQSSLVDAPEEEVTTEEKPAEKTMLMQEPPQESLLELLPKKSKTRAGSWQLLFYMAPAMTYRTVVDEKANNASFAGPVANNSGVTANKVIRYRPGMGIEMGLGAMYHLTNRVRIRTGIQYNARQFNIEAFNGGTELSRIALVRGSGVDTIQAITRFRSNGGYTEAELLNKYHQIAIPVGIEYALVNAERIGLTIGGSLQPTYTFSQSSYLLTSDYKSYADGTSMLRKWNLNSSIEALLTLRSGNVEWRFGPQLRYQHLPTYSDPYPIKEYMVDYGFKIGFTKTLE